MEIVFYKKRINVVFPIIYDADKHICSRYIIRNGRANPCRKCPISSKDNICSLAILCEVDAEYWNLRRNLIFRRR